MCGLLDEVDLALLEGGHRRGRVGDDDPLHAVDGGAARARVVVGRIAPRHVVLVPEVDRLGAGHPFLLGEDEGPRADLVALERLVRRLHRLPLGDDERHVAVLLGERAEHEAVRLLQLEDEGLVVRRLERGRLGHELLPRRVLHRPALQRRDGVDGPDRLPIVPLEPVSEDERVRELVRAHSERVHHLGLRGLPFESSAKSVS